MKSQTMTMNTMTTMMNEEEIIFLDLDTLTEEEKGMDELEDDYEKVILAPIDPEESKQKGLAEEKTEEERSPWYPFKTPMPSRRKRTVQGRC